MFHLRVKVSAIQAGCILSEDVFSKTNRPIIPKKTVITTVHIHVLKAFMIQEVDVENTLVDGETFQNRELADAKIEKRNSTTSLGFTDLFLISVHQFKKEFISWQSGLPINIANVRSILLPLLKKMNTVPNEIFNLYRLSTKETYLYQHPIVMGIISGFIGKKMNLEKGGWLQVALAGCLADCGMAKLANSIVNKETSLSIQEYQEVKNHPIYSYDMVKDLPILRKEAKNGVLLHHERLDGSGYPLGKKDMEIPLYAKIIAVADIFHAMTSERPYRSKQSPYKALEVIHDDNFGKFDLPIIQVLMSNMVQFSTGDKIRLSDGRVAEILFVDEKSLTRPLIKIIDTAEIIPLERNRHIYIDDVLS